MLLTGKKLLIFGFASTRSIAWGIALSAAKHGAELILCCANEKLAAKANLACTDANLKNTSIYTLDVSDEKLTQQVLQDIHQDHPAIDGIIHAIAYAPRESLQGNITDNITAEGFMNSLNISVYSFLNIAKMAPSMMPHGGAMLTLSYIGANQAMPGYNIMGLAKASLESSVRYLAMDLGKHKIRVNGISAGPIRTLAAAAISDFRSMLAFSEKNAPLAGETTIAEVGDCAVYLTSDLSRGTTGDIIYVDHGYHATGMLSTTKES